MTRDEAIAALWRCLGCKRWVTTQSCVHCWVDQHRCPPTIPSVLADLNRAIALGTEASQIAARLARASGEQD